MVDSSQLAECIKLGILSGSDCVGGEPYIQRRHSRASGYALVTGIYCLPTRLVRLGVLLGVGNVIGFVRKGGAWRVGGLLELGPRLPDRVVPSVLPRDLSLPVHHRPSTVVPVT